jgi:hypothetical protein
MAVKKSDDENYNFLLMLMDWKLKIIESRRAIREVLILQSDLN